MTNTRCERCRQEWAAAEYETVTVATLTGGRHPVYRYQRRNLCPQCIVDEAVTVAGLALITGIRMFHGRARQQGGRDVTALRAAERQRRW